MPAPRCRNCASSDLTLLADLGQQAPVSFPTDPAAAPPPSPLVLLRCPICTLVQLRDTLPAEARYSTYWYRSGTNEVMVAELRDIVRSARARVSLTPRSVVIDTGANDGTLLRMWAETANSDRALPYRIAIEPATNLYESLRAYAEQIHQVCWPSAELHYLPDRSVAVVTSIAMLYGADDLGAFIQEVNRVLRDDGVWIVQFQDLLSGIRTTAIDYVVHEHLMWFSTLSLNDALEPYGLRILDLEPRAINGGSLRCYIGRRGASTEAVPKQLFEEAKAGIHAELEDPRSCWSTFWERVRLIREAVPATVHAAVEAGQTVDLYACSTKASLLLQLCGLDATWIRQGVERQPQKVGRYVGGSGIPIVSEETWRRNPSDLTILGAYQFAEAFLARESAYLSGGGQFLVPIPTPTVVRHARQAAEGFKAGEDVA